MTLEDEHKKNIERGLTFEVESKEEGEVEQEAEKSKRDLVRERPLQTARTGRSRKRT